MALASGTRLGPYEILEPIGAGGMGEVYRARDTKLGRDVAIKVLPGEVADSPERLARFEREAQLLASLNHPNIATVHGLEQADGIHYLVMELVPGETLAETLVRGAIPVDDVVALIPQIIDGLEAAHENGVVHRDLKPANIIVTSDGVVKILDFGLAKAFEPEGAEVDSSLSPTITRDGTQAGVILGTAAYMSPEQARGKPVDKRTDIFSFGSVVFEMLSGKKAFDGDMISDILAAVIKLEPDWSQLPSSRLDELVRRCLEKDPKRRLRDIGDARPELEEAMAPQAVRNVDARKTLGFALTVGVGAGIVAALGLASFFTSPAPKEVTRYSIILPPSSGFTGLSSSNFAISPDGSALVFAHNRELFVRHRNREEIERIPGTADAREVFFSPDGGWVGFVSDGTLKKASLSGGPSVTLCTARDVFGADWGEDGTIIFAGRDSGVWRVSADGGEPELVLASEGMVIRYPELLADGNIVFTDVGVNRSPEEFQIVVGALETGERRPLALRGTEPQYLSSGHLVFVDQDSLMAVAFDARTLTVLGAPVAIVNGISASGGRLGAPFAVSNSGTLVYRDQTRARQLAWVDRSGDTLALVSDSRDYGDVRFSPDGRRVAISDASPGVDIWAYDVERETFTRVSHSPVFDEVPIWSPDGRFIAYTTSSESFGRTLHRRAADGSGSEQAWWQTPHHAHLADWTSDGKSFLLAENRPDTGWDVLALSAEGEPKPRDLLHGSSNERNPRLDPGGKWLAYESDESGMYEIYVTSYPEPGPKHLVSSGGGAHPVWSADGSELYYRGFTDVSAVAVDDGAEFSVGRPIALFEDRFPRETDHTTYDVHPDGRFLFVARPSAEDDPYQDLYRFKIVVNWMAEVEQRVPAP